MRTKAVLKYKMLVYIFSIIVIILLQTTIIDFIKINNVKPNLILVYTICTSILEGSVGGGIIGVFAGLVQDILSGKNIGFYALIGMYLGVIAGMINRRLHKDNILVVIFFNFLLTIIYEFGIYLLSNLGGQITNIFYMFKNILLIEAVYNAGLSIVIHLLVLKINRKFEFE